MLCYQLSASNRLTDQANFSLMLERLSFSGLLQSWKPRWGFKRGKDKTKDWLIEVPENAGMNTTIILAHSFLLL